MEEDYRHEQSITLAQDKAQKLAELATSSLARPKPDASAQAELGDAWWTAAWRIPQDFPTGTETYKVMATDLQGNTQDWAPSVFCELR